jgi:hypothetical protein
MAKKKGSYNPFYIPSLDALKAQSRQEAQAQVDASVAALPKTSDLQSQFDKTGREFKAMDTGYQAFLQNQQLAAPALFDTGTDVQATTATGITDPGAAQKAKQASNVLAMQGFGFANERQSAISGAAAKVNENQARNRRQLNDALLQLTNQIAAEKAKFSPLYYQTLNDKKSQALNAYQAYLGAQLNNAQLNAQVTNDQAQIDVSQQNADTAANKAAAAAAARDAAGHKVMTPSQKLARSKAINKVFTDADKMISTGIPGSKASKVGIYSVRYKSGVDADGNAKFATITVEYPIEKPVTEIEAELKAKYGGVGSSAPTAILTSTRTDTTKIKTPQTYKALYNFMYAALRRFRGGYTPAHTKKVVKAYLKKNGFLDPADAGANVHG